MAWLGPRLGSVGVQRGVDGASDAPEGAPVRHLAMVAAVVALVAIGAGESAISTAQLSDLPGRGGPALAPGGAALTLVGLLLSVAAYAALGWVAARLAMDEGAALGAGATVGLSAGLLGGTVRALFVRDYLSETVSRFGLPSEFTTWSLAIFVALSVVASAAGGGAITWLSFRFARARSRRPHS